MPGKEHLLTMVWDIIFTPISIIQNKLKFLVTNVDTLYLFIVAYLSLMVNLFSNTKYL